MPAHWLIGFISTFNALLFPSHGPPGSFPNPGIIGPIGLGAWAPGGRLGPSGPLDLFWTTIIITFELLSSHLYQKQLAVNQDVRVI
jgi:hypothetical protein